MATEEEWLEYHRWRLRDDSLEPCEGEPEDDQ